jgi:hypothetical protein
VLSNGVHHDAECQDVASHDEDGEEQLANAKQLASDCPKENITSVGEVLDMGVALMKLPDHIAGIGREKTQADDQDESTMIRSISLDERVACLFEQPTAQGPTGQESLARTRHQVKPTQQS